MGATAELNPYVWATVDDYDLDLWNRQLRDFVPPDSFDAHAHLWRVADLGSPTPPLAASGPAEVTRAVYDKRLSMWMPNRCPTGGLFFPYPTQALDVDAANRHLADEMKSDPQSRGLMIITPRQDPAAVERQVIDDRFVGFKVYHLFADRSDTLFAPTEEFLPEWTWELADQRGLVIMLHMVLPRALAETENQQYIREHCLRYRGAKLILAHAARGFCGKHTVEGIDALRGLENVYFDTSAVCEAEAFEAILVGDWVSAARISNWASTQTSLSLPRRLETVSRSPRSSATETRCKPHSPHSPHLFLAPSGQKASAQRQPSPASRK